MMNPPEILAALGGRSVVAAELDMPLRAIHAWALRGFPAHSWHRIAELAKRKGVAGITVETLQRPLWKGRRRGADAASVSNDRTGDANHLSTAA